MQVGMTPLMFSYSVSFKYLKNNLGGYLGRPDSMLLLRRPVKN